MTKLQTLRKPFNEGFSKIQPRLLGTTTAFHDLGNASISCLTCTHSTRESLEARERQVRSAAPQMVRHLLGAEEGGLPKRLPMSALTWLHSKITLGTH